MRNYKYVFSAVLMAGICYAQIAQPVHTDGGQVRGVPGRDRSITAFKGVPYAEPPVGNLRWVEPHPPRPWEGVRNADHFSDGCAQNFPQGDFPKSEDCLYLNVWTPAKSGKAGLPVMVYIHGGGLRVGSAREALYDGEELAKKGIVVVTLNYRLGILGFFAHPELSRQSPYHTSGNYGLLDQNAALQWVNRNISAFGGDPRKVAVFGQSGGAFSVVSQVVSPLSKGLFRAAIVESGGVGPGFARTELLSLEDGEKAGVKFAESVGVRTVAELRAMPAEKLLSAGSAEANVDGRFFPASPLALLQEGKQNKVAMIVGSNSDEGQHLFRSPLPPGEYLDKARTAYGPDADKFLTLYPNDSEDASHISQQRMFADRMAWGEQNLAAAMAGVGANVYLYYFDYLDEGGYNGEPATLGLRLGADHGAELPYVFGLLNHWKAAVPYQDLQLQNTVMQYWTNFVRNLNPNGQGLPVWHAFHGFDSPLMVLDKSPSMRRHPRAAQVEFLRAHGIK
ncbi:MAG: carboxylesterase family protein [Acidobacteria bacterium]|nr:carboxylesterase family protein [Acidobacteriota bacterium]